MEGIAGNAEAGADVLFAKERIGGDPAAQLAGELTRVLHGGFRHEYDEFVATVARDDVGAAAVGLENLADALENEVAFEVTVKIVDEFEAVQVHEYESKGAARARGTLPFRGKSFHEEAMRFDAGEAIGDGLLLSLLERKRVVESAGDEVGKRPQQQDFFVGEIHWRRGFDIQNAVKLLRIKNRQGHGGDGIRKQRFQGRVVRRAGAERRHLAVARDMPNQAAAQRNALAERAATRTSFSLNHNFARGVIQRT